MKTEQLEKLKQYLEISIKRNGDKPLTLSHLANIIGVIIEDEHEKELDDIVTDGRDF